MSTPKSIHVLSLSFVKIQRDESSDSLLRPCAHAALHFVRRSSQLTVHFLDLYCLQINPIDGAHINRQSPSHELDHIPFGVLELVHNWNTTGGTESVPACFRPKSVDGEMVSASELDVLLEGVDPEVGVLSLS